MIKRSQDEALSQINVTPFIDVMLVLLIIFMVVTPLITSSAKIELPKSTQNAKQDDKNLVIISIDKDKVILVNNEAINKENLAQILAQKTKNNFDEIIYFYVDVSVEYGLLMKTINEIKSLGYSKIALSSEVKK
ncbi:biopolymer transporter ExbD [Campylobacter sp. FMV-PI01]|uniref:Biopolymer transporter ExbD n=1 Tax=Campylobacter portucalensis TaxID=2608384 RepID=A0A6L5WKA4_9BACT|nr:biopolymer transporter ExbD [Campylobacter portucalensis]MSN96852.1 biopolymer transporter ExbD [Campylobacter portucalensis]